MVIGWAGLLIAVASAAMAADSPSRDYKEGQVWEYRTRPTDDGSLLRIQKIEVVPAFAQHGPVYHISIIGVHFSAAPISGELQHLPVSRETLDASVTRLSRSVRPFPDANAGIQEWRAANGGVFTIPVAKIISSVELMFQNSNGAAVHTVSAFHP
jgi:hypothetical protein